MRAIAWTIAAALAAGIAQGQEVRAAFGRELQAMGANTDRGVAAVLANPTRAFRTKLALDARVRGTAFCVSEDGIMLTYSGYVAGRKTVDLVFHKGIRAKADVLGFDLRCGIGVLKLQDVAALTERMGHLDVIELGDSSRLQAGETVFSSGNAYDSIGIDGVPALSRGIVTTLGRMRDAAVFGGYAIETDAAVNPGSFGGPLLDRAGKAVGVVIPVYSERRFLGCAVPSNQVRTSLEAIVQGKPLRAPRMGVQLEHTGGEAQGGLKVVAVEPGSPAHEAGLKAGDRLVRFDGTAIHDPADVSAQLAQLTPGCPVRLSLRREGKIHQAGGKSEAQTLTLSMVLGEGAPLPPPPAIAQRPPQPQPRPQPQPQPQPQPEAKQGPRLGVEVAEKDGAVVVVAVDPDSASGRAGLRAGDVIKKLGATSVGSMDDLASAVQALGNAKQAKLTLERGGWSRDVTLDFAGGAPSVTKTLPVEKRGYFGVWMTPGDGSGGALLDAVSKGSPAQAAGLEAGDRIVMANGKRIGNTDALVELLATLAPKSNLILRVERGDREELVRVTLGQRPERTPEADLGGAGKRPYLGAQLDVGQGGLKVVDIDPQGPLAANGVKPGDMLLRFGKQPLSSLDALAKALSGKQPGDTVELEVSRDGWTKTLSVRLGSK